MKFSVGTIFVSFLLLSYIDPAHFEASPEPEEFDPQETGGTFYSKTRTSSTRKRTRHRNKKPQSAAVVYDDSYLNSKQGRKNNQEGRLFDWNLSNTNDLSGGSSKRIVKTKKITKISQLYGGTNIHPIYNKTSTFTYSYNVPGGSSSSVSTYKNSTSYSGGSAYRTGGSGATRYGSSSSSSNSFGRGRGSSGENTRTSYHSYNRQNKKISSSQGNRIGVGEDYLKNTEDDLIYDYEEEVYDPEFARGPHIDYDDQFHPLVIRGFGQSLGYGLQNQNPCDSSSCYPVTGNLLIGREEKLSATSTCGIKERKEKYCIVSHLKYKKSCFLCDSRNNTRNPPRYNSRYSHRVQSVIYRVHPTSNFRSWWQSENGKEEVSIQLNLEAEFHFTHLIMTFRTFRPAAMFIERSYDNGQNWKVYRYFAYNCAESFPGVPQGPPRTITDVVCESRYSQVEPSNLGEVIFRVLQPNIKIDDPYSDEVQNLLKITNLRVNFTKLHTLGDELLDTRPEIKEKYYYAIYDMVVRGSCSCYGHASRCVHIDNQVQRNIYGHENFPSGMVYGKCECTHNTWGENCKKCKDFYNDLPWRPAISKETNACKSCECNKHTTRCHFDQNVYESTGRITGGVCDDCRHNTQGRNCQECVPYFYQEHPRSLTDPEICQPCNCDPRGSVDDGICDSRTDVEGGLVAGRCRCKQNVDGLKCNRCKAGYWMFEEDNPLGCQECSCNLLGTLDNAGCDEYTGKCHCKRNVIGRDCNQCASQHYGLSEHPDGCLACQCDKGGALDNDCDVLSGQCRCRPHVAGRQCDHPEEGYFVPYLYYLTYEAELARGSENCQVVMREPHRDVRPTTWTGIGFMRVFDGSNLEFEIQNVESSMEYDLVLKYEPQFRGSWDGVKLKVERPSPVDQNGPCANTRPFDDTRTFELSDNGREKTLFPPVCLEAGKKYKIILEFFRSNSYGQDAPSASILIDSISLIPRVEQLPYYAGSLEKENTRMEYQHYRCSEPFYTGQGLETLPELCVQNHLVSAGLYIFKQSYSCQCDGTGSRSSLCDPYGGQCDCKTNVEGRRCDRCAPGTYGFGPEGCEPCECSSQGALDNFCDQQTGKCNCRPNTYGRQCNECQPGYWNFPNCQRCECNGHADSCDLLTGDCLQCRDNTTGPDCSFCVESYYGDPRLNVGIACRPCPCPGTIESRHSFAHRCYLDPRTKDVICECEEGYSGSRCDVCSDNYFGNPELPGGSCESCDCSNNIDISRPGNCDARTGECVQCLFDADGFNCERCKEGYHGDAQNQQCRQCDCNLLGTNFTSGSCDHLSGQCPCFPYVMNVDCGKCSPFHWKLASGIGCEECACDEKGAYSRQCNEYDGQCDCKPGFGGRQCNQCQANFYGDPRIECIPCNCNRDGSKTSQCDFDTGECDCIEGIGGFKCDECDRGFTGVAPYCSACGECFDNWDYILGGLKDRTRSLIDSASSIKQSGATGAYKYEFENMEDKLDDVRKILLSANMTSKNLEELTRFIDELNQELEERELHIGRFELEVDNTTQRISLASNTLADLRLQANELKNQAKDLKDKATRLQEGNVEGALNLTRLAGERSHAAQVEVEYTEIIVRESGRYRKQTEKRLISKADRFNRTITENENALEEMGAALNSMEELIPELNQQVCDGRGDPCNSFCGGAGCGKCGGLSCNDGLVNSAQLALKFAEDTETLLKGKEASADDLLRRITLARDSSNKAFELAKEVLESSLQAQNSTSSYKASITILLDEIENYFHAESAKPSDIIKLAEEILALTIKLKPEQITDLADKITLTIRSLTDIDTILNATSNNLNTANALKERADRAKLSAEETLSVAQRVVDALNESREAQNAAEEAISKATDDITATEVYLTQIASETSAAQAQANASRSQVLALGARVDSVQGDFKINQQHLEDTTIAVSQAALMAQRATNEAKDLDDKYKKIENELDIKSKAAEDARIRADELKRRANKLSSKISSKLELLRELKIDFEENELKLTAYDTDISHLELMMEEYHEYILNKATVYATCTANQE